MENRQTRLIAAPLVAFACLLHSAAADAQWLDLWRENFNDVSGINAAGGVRSVTDILANDPGQLPPGTSQISASASPNVRRADDNINTINGDRGFDGYFDSKFLVLGDDSGRIGDIPTGAQEDTAVLFPFTLPAHSLRLRVSFDFAFDGIDSSPDKTDHLAVALLSGPNAMLIGRLSSDTDLGSSGHVVSFFDIFTELDPAVRDYQLRFRLNETDNGNRRGSTNTAAGIDDIRIAVEIPEPSGMFLLGAGLVALAVTRRRALLPSGGHCLPARQS